MATYVISDIHSHLSVLKDFLKDITEEDRVICLGDTIDKGPDGIRVLNLIRNDPRFTLLMGNHELMMLQFLMAEYNLQHLPKGSLTTRLRYLKAYKEMEMLWLDWNDGMRTLRDFQSLSAEEQNDIHLYLYNLPVLMQLEVNQRQFVLVHSYPARIADRPYLYYEEVKDHINDFVWARDPYCKVEGKIVIVGHTIVQYEFRKDEVETDGEWYDIDLGLAMDCSLSKLAVLKLDDLSVRYYPLVKQNR